MTATAVSAQVPVVQQYQAASGQWGHYEQHLPQQQHYMASAPQQQPDYMAYYSQQPQPSLGPSMAQQASLTLLCIPHWC